MKTINKWNKGCIPIISRGLQL